MHARTKQYCAIIIFTRCCAILVSKITYYRRKQKQIHTGTSNAAVIELAKILNWFLMIMKIHRNIILYYITYKTHIISSSFYLRYQFRNSVIIITCYMQTNIIEMSIIILLLILSHLTGTLEGNCAPTQRWRKPKYDNDVIEHNTWLEFSTCCVKCFSAVSTLYGIVIHSISGVTKFEFLLTII